jgi:hypothetical protein
MVGRKMKIDRLNLIVLIIFPILALGTIKLTNMVLPAKYYFSLSKLAKGADEPFIVDPPSVTEAKFCELLGKYEVEASDVNLPYIDCENLDSRSGQTVTAYTPSVDERDLIYRLAFQNDQRAIAALAADVNAVPRQPVDDERLRNILLTARSVKAAYDSLAFDYANRYRNLSYNSDGQLGGLSSSVFQPVTSQHQRPDSGFQQSQFNQPTEPSLPRAEVERILQAHQNFLNAYNSADLAGSVRNIAASDIDTILKDLYAADAIPQSFAQFYAAQAGDRVEQLLKTSFAQASLDLGNADKVRQEILSDVSQTGIPGYVLSALARVAPIFFVAILFGVYFGRREVMSISAAAGLLAFLLVWPIILLWDTVVQSQWASYREIFLGMYLLYIIAFFAVARSGALIGAYFGEKIDWHKPVAPEAGDEATPPKGYGKEIFVSLMASTIFSLVAFSINLILPLST